VLPVDFTRLLWASLFGILVFHENPELATLLGGTLIFVSTTYITFREARLAQTERAARDAAMPSEEPSHGRAVEAVQSEASSRSARSVGS
jgi:hypothetical protein